jgi:hypothetical protein
MVRLDMSSSERDPQQTHSNPYLDCRLARPSHRTLEVLLIALQIKNPISKLLTIKLTRQTKRATPLQHATIFQNRIALLPAVSGSLVSRQTFEMVLRCYLPHAPDYAVRATTGDQGGIDAPRP